MKKNLNANTLFHFTRRYEYLLNILENGFHPRYCFEEFLGGAKRFKEKLKKFGNPIFKNEIVGIPMVCFCDIRLSQINHHIENYGDYGIGLSKEWQNRQLLSQVIYMQSAENGMVSDTLQGILKQLLDYPDEEVLQSAFKDLASCVKPYEGYSWNRKNKMFEKGKTIFYNEREWRYLPKIRINHIKGEKMDIRALITLDDNFEEENTKLSSTYLLNFEEKDIKYIIVPNDESRNSLIKTIKSFNNCTPDIVIPKILTKEEIEEDF